MGSQWDGFVGDVKSAISPSTIRIVLLTGLVIFMATIAIPELVSKIPAAAATLVLTAYLGAQAVCDRKKMWTCILEFRGGTYVRQTWSASPKKVLGVILQGITDNEIRHLGPEVLRGSIEQAMKDGGDPVPVEGMKGVLRNHIGRQVLDAGSHR